MKVGSVSEEISVPSQKWMEDAVRRESSRRPRSRPTSGNGAGLGVDGKTGRERRGGQVPSTMTTTSTATTTTARGRHHTASGLNAECFGRHLAAKDYDYDDDENCDDYVEFHGDDGDDYETGERRRPRSTACLAAWHFRAWYIRRGDA